MDRVAGEARQHHQAHLIATQAAQLRRLARFQLWGQDKVDQLHRPVEDRLPAGGELALLIQAAFRGLNSAALKALAADADRLVRSQVDKDGQCGFPVRAIATDRLPARKLAS